MINGHRRSYMYQRLTSQPDRMHEICTCACFKLALQGSITRGSNSQDRPRFPVGKEDKTGLALYMLKSWNQGMHQLFLKSRVFTSSFSLLQPP